jgi:hypothetical protein
VFVELDLSHGNIFYSIVIGLLYALVGSIFNLSRSNLCARLSSLGLLLSYLGLVGVVLVVGTCCISVVFVVPVCTSP